MPIDFLQLRIFGCTAHAHVDNRKLESRAIKCLFVGYGSRVNMNYGILKLERLS